MKFICEGTILSDASFTVSKACATRTTTPILECIKIKAQNDGLTLTAYDGEISIEKKIKAEVMEEGEVCVNGKFFSDFVGKISLDEVVVISDEKGIKKLGYILLKPFFASARKKAAKPVFCCSAAFYLGIFILFFPKTHP